MIRNKVNGKVYVGSAGVSFQQRWSRHRNTLNRGIHRNSHLQRAWNLNGADSFEFIILARCNPEWCVALEQIHLNRLKAANRDFGYNLNPTAKSFFGRKHTPETREKMSAWQRGRKMPLSAILKRAETIAKNGISEKARRTSSGNAKRLMADPEMREKMNAGKRAYWKNPNPEHVANMAAAAHTPEATAKRSAKTKGRKLSSEHVAKLRAARIGKKFSAEARMAMSLAQKRRYRNPVEREKLRQMGENSRMDRAAMSERGRKRYRENMSVCQITGKFLKRTPHVTP